MAAATSEALRSAFRAWEAETWPVAPPPVVVTPSPPVVVVPPGALPAWAVRLRDRATLAAVKLEAPGATRGYLLSAVGDRSYYGSVRAYHALERLDPGKGHAARAGREAAWLRAVAWKITPGGHAVHPKMSGIDGVPDWLPGLALSQDALRRFDLECLTKHIQVTGDQSFKPLATAMVRTLLSALPATLPSLTRTERNAAFVLMGLVCGSVLGVPGARAAADQVAALVLSWQTADGCYTHDLNRHDSGEAESGLGGSPFMATLLNRALHAYYKQCGGAPSVRSCLLASARWIRDAAPVTAKGRVENGVFRNFEKSFQYLVGVRTYYAPGKPDFSHYQNDDATELNLLISATFGIAFKLTGDRAWLDFIEPYCASGEDWSSWNDPKHLHQHLFAADYLAHRAGAAVYP